MNSELLTKSVNSPEWDYTEHAASYEKRPNYADEAIDNMLEHIGAAPSYNYLVADIGAGTGNLTKMLLARGYHCIAVEPNAAMRRIGIDITDGQDVEWKIGTGENTGLADRSVNAFMMGSSFNTTNREETLEEAFRVLKPAGWFVCMWNNRDLTSDPTQVRCEKILREFYPDYSHGTRREDQTDILDASKNFKNLHYIEASKQVAQPLDDYIVAWRSVKNRFWDLKTEEGQKTFEKIEKRLREELPEMLSLTYTTRIWMIQKDRV